MQYALLIYTPESGYDGLTDEDRASLTAEAWALREDPHVVGGARLQGADLASTVRVKDGRTLVSDGPFADTKDVFGGFYLVEADDLDVAIDLATRVPTLTRLGGAVEVRPLMEGPR